MYLVQRRRKKSKETNHGHAARGRRRGLRPVGQNRPGELHEESRAEVSANYSGFWVEPVTVGGLVGRLFHD